MQIQPGDNILVFGDGAGRNMDLMDKYISGKGRIVGLDVGPEMLGVSPTLFHRSSLHYHRKITDWRTVALPGWVRHALHLLRAARLRSGRPAENHCQRPACFTDRRRVYPFGLQWVRSEAISLACAPRFQNGMSPGNWFYRPGFTSDTAGTAIRWIARPPPLFGLRVAAAGAESGLNKRGHPKRLISAR